MEVISHGSTTEVTKDTPGSTADVMESVNRILGYDIRDVDSDVYERAVARLRTEGESVPAEDVLGNLDEG